MHCWLRNCATSRKVAGSIPGGVMGIYHWYNPSGRTMVLGSTQPLIQMSTRNISCGVKVVGAYGWQPYHLHVPTVLKSGSLNLLEPSRPVQGNGIALPFFFVFVLHVTFPPETCPGPGGWSPTSHCGSPGSIPGPCDICGRRSGTGTCFFSEYFGYPLSEPLHQCSMLILITCCSYQTGKRENGENWISSLKG